MANEKLTLVHAERDKRHPWQVGELDGPCSGAVEILAKFTNRLDAEQWLLSRSHREKENALATFITEHYRALNADKCQYPAEHYNCYMTFVDNLVKRIEGDKTGL